MFTFIECHSKNSPIVKFDLTINFKWMFCFEFNLEKYEQNNSFIIPYFLNWYKTYCSTCYDYIHAFKNKILLYLENSTIIIKCVNLLNWMFHSLKKESTTQIVHFFNFIIYIEFD